MSTSRPELDSHAPDPVPGEEVLKITGLRVRFGQHAEVTDALRGVNLSLHAGKVLGVAGESGSGKTTAALAAMRLLAPNAHVEGSINYRGTELLELPEKRLRRLRGEHLAMIFQETLTALNPVIRVGDQLMMAARAHLSASRSEMRSRVAEALADVRLTDTERVMSSYPHELSGGMCQRVVIAMALSCGSRVLLADEPTTALDVSVQAEVLELVKGLVERRHLAVMMISHDLAVLSEVSDDLAVMYRGEVVESGPTEAVLGRPVHPYTVGLLDCLPRLRGSRGELPELALSRSDVASAGCQFRARCPLSVEACNQAPTLSSMAEEKREVRCWRAEEIASVWDATEAGTRHDVETIDSSESEDHDRPLAAGEWGGS